MKRIKSTLALMLCAVLLFSVSVVPIMKFTVSAEDSVVTLTADDFEIKAIQDCIVEGNTVYSVAGKQYPRIYVNLDGDYNVASMKITGTPVGVSYSTGPSTHICLAYSDDPEILGADITSCGWNYASWTVANGSAAKTAKISADYQVYAVNQIRSYGYWAKAPASDREYSFTIDKIEITESKLLKAQEIKIESVTATDIGLSVSSNPGDTIELRYSDAVIDESNFASAATLALGEDGKADLTGLAADTLYYFAAKVTNGGKEGYFFTSATTYPESEADSIVITDEEIQLSPVSNVTVSENTVVSTENKTASFILQLPTYYYASGIKITAKAENNSLYTTGAGIQLLDGDTKMADIGYNIGFTDSVPTVRYVSVPQDIRTKAINQIKFTANWYDIPAGTDQAKLTIEKIELIGKEAIIPPEIEFVNETGNSVEVSWETVKGASYELWYSTAKLSAENFDTVTDKIKVYEGTDISATVSGLTERTDYYFVLKVIKNGDFAYSADKVIPLSLDSEWIVLDEDNFKLTALSNCTVKGNMVTQKSSNLYPQLRLDLDADYLIEEIIFTISAEERTYIINHPNNNINLKNSSDSSVTYKMPWKNMFFKKDTTTSKSQTIPAEYHNTLFNQMTFTGYWGSGSAYASFTIDKIEIKGSRKISEANITYDKITGESVNVNWNLPGDTAVKLWYSQNELTAENFASADKTQVAQGRISSANVNGLTSGKMCYFALEVISGKETFLFFSSVKPVGAVYDFEKSTKLSDYTVKTRSGSELFYRINGNEKISASIVETEEYSDFGNAFKMEFNEYTAARYPILFFYAPNWADFAGEGFSMTIGKTKNHLGEDITVSANIQISVDGYGTYETVEEFETKTFTKDTTKRTVEFMYKDFFSNDANKTPMTADLSEHITAIRIHFNVPASKGAFSLYFDSIRVINPTDVVREVTGLSFRNGVVTLQEGAGTSQTPVFAPYNATENKLTWHTDTPEVVSIDAETGNVVANKMGVATVFATAPSGASASYKVVVKEDARGVVYRELFCFDDGKLPDGLSYGSSTATLDYIQKDEGGSLYLKSAGAINAVFTVADYNFYGEGIGIWACGAGGGKQLKIQLVTDDGRIFAYSLIVDNEVGNFVTIDYSLFKNTETNTSPTEKDIIGFKKMKLIYDKELYVDSIKVKDPMVYNIKQYPENTVSNTEAEITDNGNALADYKYYFDLLEIGADYNWATGTLIDAEIIDYQTDTQVYSLYFVDENFVQQDLSKPITVTLDIPQFLEGMNNIWVLYLDDGSIQGVTAHIEGNSINFEAQKSGIYCIVAGDGDKFLTKKVQSSEDIQIMVSPQKEAQTISKDITTIRRKKAKNTDDANSAYFNWLWVIIPIAFLVIVGTITAIILILKKRKKKGGNA